MCINPDEHRAITNLMDKIIGIELKREQHEPNSKHYKECTKEIQDLEKQIDKIAKKF